MCENQSNLVNSDAEEPEGRFTLAQRLHYLKKQNRLTAAQVAEYAGVPLGTVNKILCGATKKPSIQTIEKLARLFNVPIRYFAADGAQKGPQYAIGVAVESRVLQSISMDEWELVRAFRQLGGREERVVKNLIRTYLDMGSRRARRCNTMVLPCYTLAGTGRLAADIGSLRIRRVCVVADELASRADYAIQLIGDTMEPLWKEGTLLAVRRGHVCHGEVGVFCLNGKGFVRRYYNRRGVCKLQTLNRAVPNVAVGPEDTLQHMGIVLGELQDADTGAGKAL